MRAPLRALLAAAALAAAFPAVAAAKKPLPAGVRVDLNRATVAELMRLPGIGEKRAQSIVAHRQKQPFRRIEDVMQVKGLGRAWFERTKANLAVGTAPAAPPAQRK